MSFKGIEVKFRHSLPPKKESDDFDRRIPDAVLLESADAFCTEEIRSECPKTDDGSCNLAVEAYSIGNIVFVSLGCSDDTGSEPALAGCRVSVLDPTETDKKLRANVIEPLDHHAPNQPRDEN